VRAGDAEEIEVKLEHSRNLFGPITGIAGVPWHEQRFGANATPAEPAPETPAGAPKVGSSSGPPKDD
jgi:hypothetical protein